MTRRKEEYGKGVGRTVEMRSSDVIKGVILSKVQYSGMCMQEITALIKFSHFTFAGNVRFSFSHGNDIAIIF